MSTNSGTAVPRAHRPEAGVTPRVYGRERETDEVVQRLRERRLVTITGPGGIGKTALAKVAAGIVGPDFDDGAIVVDLTRIDSDEGVAEAIAGQLGYADFDSLMASPSDQPALILIDNCEHVLDAAADAIDEMLAACRMPTILATSRSPLDLPDETIIGLSPLPVPPAGEPASSSPAVELFSARARDHGVDVPGEHSDLVAEIVRRLDGVPLAIELAAARLRTIGVADLLAELDRRPHDLARPRFRGQPNHRSVAELVDWSYRMLDEVERTAFVDLSVFSGPFRADLGRRVCALDDQAWKAALDALVDAALVVVSDTTDGARYRLLHPVRAVARDLLDHSGRAGAVRDRLVDTIIEHSSRIVGGGPRGWRPDDLHDLLDLYDDAAASIRWTLEHDRSPDRSLTLVAVLWGVVHNAHAGDIHQLGEQVLIRWPDESVHRWPNAAATVATCRFLDGDLAGAMSLAERALDSAESSRTAPVLLRRVIAQSRRASGDANGAVEMFRHAADLADERGAHGLAMEMRVDEGLALVELGDVGAGLDLIERTLAAATAAEAGINRMWARTARAAVLFLRDGVDALPEIEATLSAAREMEYPAGITYALRTLARAHLRTGDLPQAAATARELLWHLLQRGGLDEMRTVLDVTAEIGRLTGDAVWRDLLATARTMPITSFVTPISAETDALDDSTPGEAMTVRSAYIASRDLLTRVVEAQDDETATADDRTPSPPARSDGAVTTAVMAADGDVWRFDFAGRTVRIKRSKGLDDLATLLSAPDRDVSVLDLTGTPAAVASQADDVLLDDEARHQYEQRVRDLHADIEDADAANDIGRAERSRVELDAIVDELTAAMGLGGRSRRVSGTVERARQAVTQRLRSAIRRLESLHPELASHLERSVSTGTYCRYASDPAVTWSVAR